MGLDMYLYRKNGTDNNDVAYWRKANAIHKWFVDNVQDKVDDCDEYRVTGEQLDDLVDRCKQILDKQNGWEELASELLPTQDGFFFGCTEYDDDYRYKLHNTVSQLEELRGDTDNLFYRASW